MRFNHNKQQISIIFFLWPCRIEEKELLTIINNIFNELDKKRKIAINKNDKDLRDEIETCRLEETTIDYMLYIILEFAGKLI